MAYAQNFARSIFGEQVFRRTFYGAELGVPQAIFELAKTYIAMRNFSEAIAWSRTLAENPNLVEQAKQLLFEIISASTDPFVLEAAHNTIHELDIHVAEKQIEQKSKLEKQSFLLPATEVEIEG